MSPRYISILAAAVMGGIQLGLIIAKLTGDIHWRWLWVLTPLWVPVVVAVSTALVIIAMFARMEANGENPFQ